MHHSRCDAIASLTRDYIPYKYLPFHDAPLHNNARVRYEATHLLNFSFAGNYWIVENYLLVPGSAGLYRIVPSLMLTKI